MTKKLRFLPLILLLTLALTAEQITYTAKEKISLQGKANSNVLIEVYVNVKKVAETRTNDNGEWVAYNIPLNLNTKNELYAVAVSSDGMRSKTSTKLTIINDTTIPKIYSAVLEPPRAKPGDTVKIYAKVEDTVITARAIMPDNALVALLPPTNSNIDDNWTGEWKVPEKITGGTYKVLVGAANRVGTQAQNSEIDLLIDAKASVLVQAPLDGARIYDDTLVVSGVARNSVQVEAGVERLDLQPDGSFSGLYRIPKPGRNQLIVTARDRSGSTVEQAVSFIKLITFPDIQNHWARAEIEYLATLGYIQAYESGAYAPDNGISRAELATLLVRARQMSTAQYSAYTTSSFLDVPKGYWALGYIEAAANSGIVEGYPNRTYKPTNPVTRVEAAALFIRFANIPPADGRAAADIDVGDRHWGRGIVSAFKSSGLMPDQWKSEQRFQPNRAITRGEVAAILARVKSVNVDIENMLGRPTTWASGGSVLPQAFVSNENTALSEATTDGSSVIMAVVLPRDVLPGNDVIISVACMQKMRQVSVILPDKRHLPLQYNATSDLWENSWRIPNDLSSGLYQLPVRALADSGTIFAAQTDPFAVTNAQKINQPYLPQETPQTFPEQQTTVFSGDGYVYPPVVAAAAQPRADGVSAPAPAAGGTLTRAAAAAILAKHGYLRQAKVSAPPAKDVALTHPQVQVIKSAIVTGLIPNKKPGYFLPNDHLTYPEAAAILQRAKISGSVPPGQGNISPAEFEDLVTRR
ncbi:protein S-layer homology domain [Candidatus Termititenax persephonae]|uniref:Protein S-layer homology domain n=1 Tax=Candidatus Termititenax persephonae TaxID=2218525 RepID=A0A388TF34_9BACT|nr:protein S-layer homology domain [Candidatus Termititenax persephonae]